VPKTHGVRDGSNTTDIYVFEISFAISEFLTLNRKILNGDHLTLRLLISDNRN
jgi:hypothetical protein